MQAWFETCEKVMLHHWCLEVMEIFLHDIVHIVMEIKSITYNKVRKLIVNDQMNIHVLVYIWTYNQLIVLWKVVMSCKNTSIYTKDNWQKPLNYKKVTIWTTSQWSGESPYSHLMDILWPYFHHIRSNLFFIYRANISPELCCNIAFYVAS